MNMNRNRPSKGVELELWFSECINDAIRDAHEAGMPTRSIWFMLKRYAESEKRYGLIRDEEDELRRALGEACDGWEASAVAVNSSWLTAEMRGPQPQHDRIAELRKLLAAHSKDPL